MRKTVTFVVMLAAIVAISAGVASATMVENFDGMHGFETAYFDQIYIDTVNKLEGTGSLAGWANTGSSGTYATTVQTSQDLNVNAAGADKVRVRMYFSDVSAIHRQYISVWLYSGTAWSGNNIRFMMSPYPVVGWNDWTMPFSAAYSTSGTFNTADVANYQVQIYGNGTVAEYEYKIDGLELLGAPVPEPSSLIALGTGMFGLIGLLRRRSC